MRSSKSRSRSKSNRNRPSGNIVNRVFDSSGPEGKVRGTPQQIIDKYLQLTRDAQLSNDRVAAENFQQHAEHYIRLLGEAQREQDARREQQERDQRDRQQKDRDDRQGQGQQQQQQQPRQPEPGEGDQPDIIDTQAPEEESGLVETPESKPAPRPRRSRAKKPAAEQPAAEQPNETPQAGAPGGSQIPDEAAE